MVTVKQRIQSFETAIEKAQRLRLDLYELDDLAGLRVVSGTRIDAETLCHFFRDGLRGTSFKVLKDNPSRQRPNAGHKPRRQRLWHIPSRIPFYSRGGRSRSGKASPANGREDPARCALRSLHRSPHAFRGLPTMGGSRSIITRPDAPRPRLPICRSRLKCATTTPATSRTGCKSSKTTSGRFSQAPSHDSRNVAFLRGLRPPVPRLNRKAIAVRIAATFSLFD